MMKVHCVAMQDAPAAGSQALQRRVSLRDRASAVLKEEIAEMRRRETRGRVDLTYVKSVGACCVQLASRATPDPQPSA